jgi:hypothetical protein
MEFNKIDYKNKKAIFFTIKGNVVDVIYKLCLEPKGYIFRRTDYPAFAYTAHTSSKESALRIVELLAKGRHEMYSFQTN